MDKSPTKWFSLSEAFRHFADQNLLRRVDELEPYWHSHNKHTEHLFKEHSRLSRKIHRAMIERLKRGELIARGLDKFGGFDEGIEEITPARWSTLNVVYSRNEVRSPNGLVLVDVEICEASEVAALNSPQGANGPDAGFEHGPGYRYVKIGEIEFALGAKQARVVEALHRASRTDEPWVHGKKLLGADTRSSSIRDLFKSKKDWRKLIKSDGNGRYCLNLPVDRQL